MDFDYTELVQSVIAGWTDDPVRRAMAALLGAGLLVNIALCLIRRKKCHVFAFLFSVLAAGILFGLALYPKALLTALMQVEYLTRLRILMGVASTLVIVITLEAVRREQLRERYALLWLATGLVILSIVLFPEVLALFRAVTGLKYWPALGSVAFIFLTLLAFHFSLTISRLHSHTTKLAQRLAVLEAQLKSAVSKSRGIAETPQPAENTNPRKPDEP
jgi:uncharacterized membrane protein YozB (DUF420 family)